VSSIAKRPGGRWRARYRDSAGKEHARHFDRKIDAQRWLDEVTAAVLTGQYVDPRAGRVTFSAYAREWQARQVHRRNTQLAVSSALRMHLLPAFGHRPLSSIRKGDVQALVQQLSTTMTPSSVATVYQYMRSIMAAAVEDRLIATSPCVRIQLPKRESRHVQPLATETVRALTLEMPERSQAMVTLMAGTGLRPGEAAGLTVDRIDFLRRTVRVDRQLLQTRPPSFGPPKTKASYRTVPLPQVVTDALAAHLARFPAGEYGLVFCQRDGRALNRDKVVIDFRAAVAKVGAPQGTHLHELRHYYASLLIRHGASVKVVQARLGHASAKETLDTYAHLWPDSEDMTRAAVDDVLGVRADSVRTEVVP
jgi:integrase